MRQHITDTEYKMRQYITDTEYAVRELIDLITTEDKRLAELQGQHKGLNDKLKRLNRSLLDPLSDDNGKEQAMAMDAGRTSEESAGLENQIIALRNSIDAKGVSIDSLCGAILQIAKQGISTVHGSLGRCPNGRIVRSVGSVGGETLRNVIWQARNQSMHYEEPNFKQPLVDCFTELENSFGSELSLNQNTGKNLAHNVIKVLGWKDYSGYESDMQSLI